MPSFSLDPTTTCLGIATIVVTVGIYYCLLRIPSPLSPVLFQITFRGIPSYEIHYRVLLDQGLAVVSNEEPLITIGFTSLLVQADSPQRGQFWLDRAQWKTLTDLLNQPRRTRVLEDGLMFQEDADDSTYSIIEVVSIKQLRDHYTLCERCVDFLLGQRNAF